MRGSLGDTYVAWDGGRHDLVAEMLAYLAGHLPGQRGPRVVHGQQDALQVQGRIEGLADPVDARCQGPETF